MSQLTATHHRVTTSAPYLEQPSTDQVDLLVDSITGAGRDALRGLSVAHVYNALAAQITAMGMRPAEQKLLRVAHWIVASHAV